MKISSKWTFIRAGGVVTGVQPIQLGVPNDGRSIFVIDDINIRIVSNPQGQVPIEMLTTVAQDEAGATGHDMTACSIIAGRYCYRTAIGAPLEALACWPQEVTKIQPLIQVPNTTIYFGLRAETSGVDGEEWAVDLIINGSVERVSQIEWQNLRIQALGACGV